MGKITIFIFIFLSNNSYSYCQNYSIEFINEKNGLSQNCGQTITQLNGYMWFGTPDGLNRYDGTRMKTYKTKDFPALGSNYINVILPEDINKLWIGTPKGLSLLDTETDKITAITHKFLYFNNKLHIKNLYKDNCGNLWATNQIGRVYKKFRNSDDFEYTSFFANQHVIGFDDDEDNTYIVSKDSIYRFSHSQNIFKKVVIPDEIEENKCIFTSLLISQTGHFWVGTLKNGLYKFRENHGILSIENHFTTSNSKLGSNEITCISEDKKGNIWIGTRASSAYIYASNAWLSLNDFNENNHTIEGTILSFYHDLQGITWIGTAGDGIAKCDPYKEKFSNILKLDKKIFNTQKRENILEINGSGQYIFTGIKEKCLLEFDESKNVLREFEEFDQNYFNNHIKQRVIGDSLIWIGLNKGLWIFNSKEKKYVSIIVPKEINFTNAICLVGNKEIWFGGTEGLKRLNKNDLTIIPIEKYHRLFRISTFHIQSLHQDQFGRIWVGTVGNGLYCYNPIGDVLTKIDRGYYFYSEVIHCFLEEEYNMLIGTDLGLFRLNHCFQQIKKVTTDEGMPNNVIYSIEKSKKSGYWIATNAGLTHATEDFTKFKNYDEDDGLPGTGFSSNCSYVSDAGFFYFGGKNCLIKFDERKLKNNKFISSLLVSDIFIDNEVLARDKWKIDSTIIVEPFQKYLKISLSVSNFSVSKNNHCAYKLEGFNDWQSVPENNELLFTGLKAGKYSLTVKGYNNDDTQTKNIINLMILVKAPFWQKWWFYMILLIIFGYFLYLWLRKEWKIKEKEIRYKSEIDEIRNVALRSQMNPHFIFNCLSAIEYLMISRSSDKAQIYLNKFSRLVRNTLDFTNNELVSLKEELAHLNIYIQLENLRYNDTIKYKQNIANDINPDSIQFPPLILQPLVENSIKHGFDITIKNPEITLDIFTSGSYFIIQLVDNGKGILNSSSNFFDPQKISYGLEVTKQRLRMYSRKINKKSEFHIYDLIEENKLGTKVIIKIEL